LSRELRWLVPGLMGLGLALALYGVVHFLFYVPHTGLWWTLLGGFLFLLPAIASRKWRWLVSGLLTIGWVLWLFAVVLAALCSGLQSNAMLAEPNDPCGGLWLGVLGGFVFLLVASFLTLRRRHDSRGQR